MNIPVVFVSDNQYIVPTYTAIFSLLSIQDGVDYDIYVLTSEDFSDENRKLIQNIPAFFKRADRLSIIPMGRELVDNYVVRGISTTTYYKLLIPWLFGVYNKIVYCDSDVIFVKGLSEVFKTDVKDYYVAGVHYSEYENSYFSKYSEKIGVEKSKYVNAGLLVMNCDKIRDDFSKESVIAASKTEYRYQDQDVLNILFKNKILKLPERFNCKANDIVLNNRLECNMIHYAGLKPWKDFTACWVEWWETAKRTPIFEPIELNKLYVKILYVQGRDQKVIKIYNGPIVVLARKLSRDFPFTNRIAKFIYRCFGFKI